jgi:hypothetical protein
LPKLDDEESFDEHDSELSKLQIEDLDKIDEDEQEL